MTEHTTVERSATHLRVEVMRFLRRFGLASVAWTVLLAVAAPHVQRTGVMWTAVAIVAAWAVASQWVTNDRAWWAGWLVAAVGLEIAAPAAGTDGWSLTGGAVLLVVFGVVLSGRRAWIALTVVVLAAVALGRGMLASGWSPSAGVATTLFLVFGTAALTWLVEGIDRVVTERDALQAQLLSARTAAARAHERAEAGARLHDTVLQHLAAIDRAPDLDEVRRHAGRAANDLRQFLRRDGGTGSLRTLLQERVTAAADGTRLSLSVVGDREAEAADLLLVDAVVEAVRNAASHGEPPLRVYAEVADEVVVYVADHGLGFDPDAIPDDRLGVRDSIVGRLRRVGGTARLHIGDTTEWELSLPAPADRPPATPPNT